MSEQFKRSLTGMWLLVGMLSLMFPILLPSITGGGLATNPIGTATVTMFILSFPSSLIGMPLLLIADYGLGVEPWSIEGRFLNLFLLFILGLVQWFWIAPRVGRNQPAMQVLDLKATPGRPILAGGRAWDLFDTSKATPLERALHDDE